MNSERYGVAIDGARGDPEVDQTRACTRLVAAVLVDAFREHNENVVKFDASRARRLDTGRWFDSKSQGPFSFLWCCSVLNLSPDRVSLSLYRPGLISEAETLLRLQREKHLDERRRNRPMSKAVA